MKTADNVDFSLGMDLYLPVGGDVHNIHLIQTSPETHFVDSFQFHGAEYHCLNRRDSKSGTDLRHFYSSRAAIIDGKIGELRQQREKLDKEIAELELLKTPA